MRTLKESLLEPTSNKTSSVKRVSSAILKELANTPSERDWKIDYDVRDCGRSIYWHIPETLQFIRTNNEYDGVVIYKKSQGLEFYVDERCPEVIIYHKPKGGGIRLYVLGWNLIVDGDVTTRKKVVMELIQKLSDFDTMDKLFRWSAEYEERNLIQDHRKNLLKDL